MGRLGTEHEDDRPGHAEMSEEHLAEMGGSFLAPLPQRRFDIAQGQARQGVRPGFFRRKGNERWFQLRHAVSQAAGKAVAVACRTGHGIGHAARRDDTGVAFVIPRRRTDDHAAAPGLDGVDGVAQMEVDALLAELAIKELAHFDGTVRLGKDAAAPFLLGSQAPGMQFIQQILIGSIGYSEKISPTLKGTASGNCMPSVLCLNDQGGSVMDCTVGITGTLRAQEHGHQPLVYENHGIDARYTGPHTIAPTLSARAGTGGNNLPLVEQRDAAHGSPSEKDGILYARQRVDVFHDNDVASTESARQYKDATDLVCQQADSRRLIRRLTPLECERLQGFPDGWTALSDASDSARYRALGNSVAIPCVEFIMRGITIAVSY